MQNQNPLGIFDSGLGGLTVVKQIIKHLPYEDIIYLGDTARVPYGSKSKQSVVNFSIQNAEFLTQHNIKCMIMACNTASSYAYNTLKDKYDIEILDVIQPGAVSAVNATRKGRIGIIGTRATVTSASYNKHILELDNKIEVFSKSCPLFVPLVEEGWTDMKETYSIAQQYLSYFDDKNIDVLILGCTHYPMLKNVLQKIIGDKITLIDSASAVCSKLEYLLKINNLQNFKEQPGRREFYVTDYTSNFLKTSRTFLADNNINLNVIELENNLVPI